jgi:hypothetical protein
MTMKVSACCLLLALAVGTVLATPAAAQQRPTMAIMPTQYFSADAESAQNVTQGLVQQYEGQGYTVLPMDRARSTFEQMGLHPQTHYADAVAVRFGRSLGADLVAYPRLLVVGIPIVSEQPVDARISRPAAVMHLRVLNVHTGQPIYFRQIAHEFTVERPDPTAEFVLPEPVATATAADVTQIYFQMVAGTRQEFRGN